MLPFCSVCGTSRGHLVGHSMPNEMDLWSDLAGIFMCSYDALRGLTVSQRDFLRIGPFRSLGPRPLLLLLALPSPSFQLLGSKNRGPSIPPFSGFENFPR